MLLEEIIAATAVGLRQRKQSVPESELTEKINRNQPPLSLSAALARQGIGLICEIKKASPSKGLLSEHYEPSRVSQAYSEGGAAAISVLTEERFFLGSLEHLQQVRAAIGRSLPVLRKDFVIDRYQVVEARACGADALLLIAAVLEPPVILELLELSHSLGMECLVEVHNENEMATALSSGARIIGINNRNLRDFSVDLRLTEHLRPMVPSDRLVVAESGIKDRCDVLFMEKLGVDAVLVGEALMKAADPAAKLRELRGQS
jgi:indole-3-glycerol phosphate synthase